VKLVVAALLLVAAVVVAKVAIERLAPEVAASASTRSARAKAGPVDPAAAVQIEAVRLTGPGLRASAFEPLFADRIGARVAPAALDAERAEIVAALIARGHLDAVVSTPTLEPTDGDAVIVDLAVDAGPVYRVRRVRAEGAPVRRHPVLGDVPVVRSGDAAIAEDLEASAALIRAWMKEHKVRGAVSYRLEPDARSKQVDVIYVVE
jgi:hemolysin activation/secretion protein